MRDCGSVAAVLGATSGLAFAVTRSEIMVPIRRSAIVVYWKVSDGSAVPPVITPSVNTASLPYCWIDVTSDRLESGANP